MTGTCLMNFAEVQQALGATASLVDTLIANSKLEALSGENGERLFYAAAVARCKEALQRDSERAMIELMAIEQEPGLYD